MHILLAVLTAAVVWAWAVKYQLALYYVGSVLVEQLPEPAASSNAFYKYFYSVIQILAANLKRGVNKPVVPDVPPVPPAPPKP